ncbi:MAG: ABC transporter substrate-binding protein, partial [Bryobacteraceae bacterium]|nr:ABC transporter substrate-binding protein [Bryobacteraceae bacterium]
MLRSILAIRPGMRLPDTHKFRLFGIVLMTVIGLGAGGLAIYQSQRVHRLTIAAGSANGESYVLSLALKVVVERHHPNVRLQVQETGGTAENLGLLEQGSAQLAAAQGDAPTGSSARMIAVLYDDKFQLLVHDGSSIRRFADLKGQRIALPQTGGQYKSFLHVAEHFGLTARDFQFIGRNESQSDQA